MVKLDHNNETERVLGLHWITKTDMLIFQFNKLKFENKLYCSTSIPTKRQFLSILMSIFDPLGLIAPFTIQGRILMQEVWTNGIGWDNLLLENEFEKWKQWLIDLENIKSCRIPRCYQIRATSDLLTIELHTFCDASQKAYSAVAYWRFVYKNGDIHTSIILSKSRVAPLKPTTIPRIEL